MNSGTLTDNWAQVCTQVGTYEEVDTSQMRAFFSRLQPQAMSEGFLMLTADNDFIRSWVETHYLDHIKRGLQDVFGMPYTVIVEVDTTSNASGVGNTPSSTNEATVASATPSPSIPSSSISDSASANDPARSSEAMVSESQTRQMAQQPVVQAVQPVQPIVQPIQPQTISSADAKPYENHHNAMNAQDDYLISSLTFENFVIGDSNRMAYSMAVDVAELPGKTPLNPLFIYGKSGLGKTHLMRAIQNYICETQPHLRTVYVDSAELLSNYMDASAAHDKDKASYKNFKNHYEEADVLLIDDIQYLQGKKQTLDIVFQIFNKLTNQGRQIVFSADRAPKNIDIDERYHSRFNRGGTIDIQPPEIETKLGIVKSFINEYKRNEGLEHFSIPEDIQMYIAENSSSNIRELKSAITKVIYQIKFSNNYDISIDDVRVLLKDHFSGGSSKNLTVEDIMGEVENFYKIKHADLVGRSRARNIVYPRHMAIYLCRQLLDLPFNNIAKKFNRDHTTAMHSVTSIEEMARNNREVQEEIEILKQMIREL